MPSKKKLKKLMLSAVRTGVIAFLVFCITSLLLVILRHLPRLDYGSKGFLFFLGGFAGYILIHTLFYKFHFMHVISHELTHALWTKFFGGKVRDIFVSEKGGRVTINKSNFLINLAPYFFPLYTILFLILSYVIKDSYLPFIDLMIGASLGFHLLLTFHSIHATQSDLKESGYVFSVMFIVFMNLALLCWVFSILDASAFALAEVFSEFTAQLFIMLERIGESVRLVI
jgi:hypothetical protein